MWQLVMNETMSGSITLDTAQAAESFGFSICVEIGHPLRFFSTHPFTGSFSLGGQGVTGQVTGTLAIRLTGPRYALDLDWPGLGPVHLAGEKTYRLRGLLASLVTCPLTLYRQDKAIGKGEVAYRGSVLAFLFRALRLRRSGKPG